MPGKQDQYEIFNSLVKGTNEKAKEIEIETPAGTLEGHLEPLSRGERWKYINEIPEGFLRAAQELDQDDIESGEVNSEEVAQEYNTLPSEEMISSFTQMVSTNFVIPDLSPGQMKELIEKAFKDELLLELGFEILNISADRGELDGFREK